MSQSEPGASGSGHMVFPREFKRSGAEQIDWKLTGFGASMFVAAFLLIGMFASLEPPQISAEEVHKRAVRVVSQLEMPDIPEEVPEPEVEEVPVVEEVEVVEALAEPVPQAEAQPRVRERAPQASGGGGESRSERRRGRGNARAAAAAAIAQQGVWAQLSTGSSGTGAAVASGISGADLESNLGKVGGVKRGGTSTFTGEGDGTGSGEGAIVGPGGGRSTQGAGDAGMDVGSLLGSGGGVGGGGATSLGGDGVGGGVDIDVSAIADARGGASTEEARSSSAVLTVMRQNLGPIQFCYQRELKLNPKLQGKLALRLTIRANGRVQKVEVASDTVRNRNLSRCVQGRVRAWRFQPASGTTVVTITLPFSPSS